MINTRLFTAIVLAGFALGGAACGPLPVSAPTPDSGALHPDCDVDDGGIPDSTRPQCVDAPDGGWHTTK